MQTNYRRTPLLVTTSWDDGHPADLRLAELLTKYGLQGTFYVPSCNSEGKPVMTPLEIAVLAGQFEIGGHTRDHVRLTEVTPKQAAGQILSNKQWLESLLGREIRGFAYVGGRHNRIVRELVASGGYSYARTIKNLMSTPGIDPMEVPTTIQFFPHSKGTCFRNLMSGGPTLRRAAVLAPFLSVDGLAKRCFEVATACAAQGGYFHLWGHSWELDRHALWPELESLFGQLRELGVVSLTNDAWFASRTKPMP